MPGWKGRAAPPPSVTKARRVASAPLPPAQRGSGGSRVETGGGTKFRASRSSLRTCSGGRARSERRRGRLPGSAGAPAPGPARGAGLCTLPLAAGLCGAHPCTPVAQKGFAPDNYEEEKERDGDLLSWPRIPRRGQGGPRAEFSLCPSPAGAGRPRRVPCAPSRLSPGSRAGPRAPRTACLPPAPLSSHFRGSGASRLRPGPAPERRPHSAAASRRAL